MKKLDIPLKDVGQRKIYQDCADSFRDKTALGYIEEVVTSTDVYEDYVPRNISDYPQYAINQGDEGKIVKVYTEKFAAKGSVGKEYYEAIMLNANGRCPICGDGKLKNLDHFLPKSKFPLLCVTPANLIPVCRDCNMDKSDTFDPDYYSLPFNPYFDSMNVVWLECEVSFKCDSSFDVIFFNGYDKRVDADMWKKYETHLRVYELDKTFLAKALEEIDNCKKLYQKLLKECGVEGVKKDLLERKESYESNDKNSWRAALYRELVRKVCEYCDWLFEDI